jgi:uncharacterized protein (DUF934 family)
MSAYLLAKSGELQEDSFAFVANDEAAPPTGDALVTLERYLGEPGLPAGRKGRLGVLVPPAADAFTLEGRLAGLSLVSIDFPQYKDGRGYTHARHLREQLGFAGELRAVGDIGIDHLFFLRRCGFDSFALREGEVIERAQAALARFSATYQPTAWAPDA